MHRPRLTRQESRNQTRKRLLDAAAEVIVSKGLAATSVEDIVVHAGYTRGAFYSNYVSKLDLFGKLLEADHARFKDRMRRLLNSTFRQKDEYASPSDAHYEGLANAMLWAEARHHAMRDMAFREHLNALMLSLLDVVTATLDESLARMGIEPSIPTSALALATLALVDGSIYFDIDQSGEQPGSALSANLDTLFLAAIAGKRA